MNHSVICAKKEAWPFIDSPWDLLVICYSTVNGNLFMAFSYTMGILSAYFLPIFSIFGIISNLHIIYIFNLKFPHKTRQTVYLSNLAAADTLNLFLSALLFMFPGKGLPFATNGSFYFFILSYGPSACIGYRVISTFTATLAINFLILTSIDRCLSIYFPFKFIKMSLKTAWILIFITVIITIIEVLPIGLTMRGYRITSIGQIHCSMSSVNPTISLITQIYRQLFCNCGFLQVILICFVNLLLLFKILQTDKLRKEIRIVANHSSKEISACTLLLVMSFVFSIATLPQVITLQIAFFMPITTSSDVMRLIYNINDISWLLFLYQESINWIIYFFRMRNFRYFALESLGIKIIRKEQSQTRLTDNNNKF